MAISRHKAEGKDEGREGWGALSDQSLSQDASSKNCALYLLQNRNSIHTKQKLGLDKLACMQKIARGGEWQQYGISDLSFDATRNDVDKSMPRVDWHSKPEWVSLVHSTKSTLRVYTVTA